MTISLLAQANRVLHLGHFRIRQRLEFEFHGLLALRAFGQRGTKAGKIDSNPVLGVVVRQQIVGSGSEQVSALASLHVGYVSQRNRDGGLHSGGLDGEIRYSSPLVEAAQGKVCVPYHEGQQGHGSELEHGFANHWLYHPSERVLERAGAFWLDKLLCECRLFN